MRSRYSAYAVGDTDYVWRTWHPRTRPRAGRARPRDPVDPAGDPRGERGRPSSSAPTSRDPVGSACFTSAAASSAAPGGGSTSTVYPRLDERCGHDFDGRSPRRGCCPRRGQAATLGTDPARPGPDHHRRHRVHRQPGPAGADHAAPWREPGRRGDVPLPLRAGQGRPARRRRGLARCCRWRRTRTSSTPRATGGRTSWCGWPTAYAGCALEHPRAFPLVASRPPEAPWLRPPLRSIDWVEDFLDGLISEGFTDESAVAGYRAFTSFLLGHLLLEVATHGGDIGPLDVIDDGSPDYDNLDAAPTVRRLRDALSEDRRSGRVRGGAASSCSTGWRCCAARAARTERPRECSVELRR